VGRRAEVADKLDAFLTQWFTTHRGQRVNTAAFERELQTFTGVDLTAFFAQWAHDLYFPVIDVSWQYAAGSVSVMVTQQQQQRGPSAGFTFPLELEFSAGTQTQRVTVDVTSKTTSASMALAFQPTAVVVDPDQWLYFELVCTSTCRASYTCGKFDMQPLYVCVGNE
jgi:aminopeptidase N